MPEYPWVTVYCESIENQFGGQPLRKVRVLSPFLLRTVDPPLSALQDQPLLSVRRLGKRIVLGFPDEIFVVLHLMIAGRIRMKAAGANPNRKTGLAAFDWDHATLVLTEASKKKRASMHLVRGEDALEPFDKGGLEVLDASLEAFTERLERNHTIKRSLTDPYLFSGIGNAYSDEILHRAGVSPIKWTTRLSDDEVERLYDATRAVLLEWTDRHRESIKGGFPDKVSAFHKKMAVHGRFKKPCPECGTEVQRIRYAENECNYCPRCQTGGKLLADRALSRLLKKDWPRTIEELENRKK